MVLSDAELDFQYACRKWSIKPVPVDEVVGDFIRITQEESDRVRSDIPHSRHIRYGCQNAEKPNKQTYDIYGIDLPKDSELVVFLHGGYWQALSKDSSANLVRPLYNEGFKVIVADYDLCPSVTLKDIIQEFKELILHIVSDTSMAPNGIWLVGHSAGAHLCSVALDQGFQAVLSEQQRQIIRGLVLISGVYELLPLLPTHQNVALSLDKSQAEECSTNEYFQSKFDGKLLIVLGQAESPEFHRQSLEIHETALAAGTASEFWALDGIDHFTIIENLWDPNFSLTRRIIEFIKSS